MRNILILTTLISGLIFTSLVKNKTRLLEKELLYLDNEINSLNFNLNEASLDFEYLTTPKYISLLAKNFLDENFSYYKESQIKKSIEPEKNLAILKKLKNDNTFTQLSTEKSVNKKSNVAKEIDNRHLRRSKKISVSKKVHNWAGLQIIKSFLGIPTIPVK
ncbi:uncharacterized protein METZ01_LOCUS290972 [marine metagenome]|uniref:Uncharacterized protein n=1 Tax=marine metagenome TaxID=408172 RepID=A0A382LN03_9ZZZZ